MLPTDDSADDHIPVVRRAAPDDQGAAHLPAIWWAYHGDRGADAQMDIDGQTYIFQAKHLLPRADAQRMTRQSVLVFLDACRSSDADHKWTSSLQQLTSMVVTQNYDKAIERLTSDIDPESVSLLAAIPDLSTQCEASTATGVFTKLLVNTLSRWSDVADYVVLLDALDETCPEDPGMTAGRWRIAESSRWWTSAGCTCPLQAVAAAQHATSAAYNARDAVVHEDASVSREAVAGFASAWLGFRPTPEIVEATTAALLYAALDDFDPDDDSTTVRRLRRDTVHQNRLLKPLTSTQLSHYPIDSLDRPLWIDLHDDTPSTLADTIGVPDQVDEFITRIGGWEDTRIDKVLARLHHDEQQVAMTYAHLGTPATWQQAAQACGLSAEFGEKVRRKLRREGQSLMAIQTPHNETRFRAA
jgi:hypothetical protein